MQRLEEFKETPTVELVNRLSEAEQQGEQGLVNIYAYELTCRIWIPNEHTSFSKMIHDFGYKSLNEILEKEDNKNIKVRQ